ncbi:ABC transporter permease [Bacillus sp. FJAT-50079]|uniref:ABC transporter permease n=1 Tax=Bacillus sp. FJAT-50079 TaxID=2833577 RepID=UPI001BC91291|nr:ABC transporter permease [Bacillus sp. FJAT-50079]MBS4210483.1 ABC transporter permease [Bacillus sp. FJAT-50079]
MQLIGKEFNKLQDNLSLFRNRDGSIIQLLILMFVIIGIMTISNPGLYLTWRNFEAIAFSFPQFGLLSIAIMVTMLSGGIDLSVISTANLSGIVAAMILTTWIPAGAGSGQVILVTTLAIVVAILVGLLCGIFNGMLITIIKIPEILATLGTMQVFMGIAIVLTKGHAIVGFPEQLLFLGNDTLVGIPIPLIIFIATIFIITVILNKTAYGYELYMLGANRTAARFTGIRNNVILLRTYMLSGCLSAIAGIMIISQTNSAKADYGSSYLFPAIVVTVMGGVNPNGGVGRVFGVIIAILSMQFLSSGFNMLRIGGSASNYVQDIAWGSFLLLVMMINYWKNKKGGIRK